MRATITSRAIAVISLLAGAILAGYVLEVLHLSSRDIQGALLWWIAIVPGCLLLEKAVGKTDIGYVPLVLLLSILICKGMWTVLSIIGIILDPKTAHVVHILVMGIAFISSIPIGSFLYSLAIRQINGVRSY